MGRKDNSVGRWRASQNRNVQFAPKCRCPRACSAQPASAPIPRDGDAARTAAMTRSARNVKRKLPRDCARNSVIAKGNRVARNDRRTTGGGEAIAASGTGAMEGRPPPDLLPRNSSRRLRSNSNSSSDSATDAARSSNSSSRATASSGSSNPSLPARRPPATQHRGRRSVRAAAVAAAVRVKGRRRYSRKRRWETCSRPRRPRSASRGLPGRRARPSSSNSVPHRNRGRVVRPQLQAVREGERRSASGAAAAAAASPVRVAPPRSRPASRLQRIVRFSRPFICSRSPAFSPSR